MFKRLRQLTRWLRQHGAGQASAFPAPIGDNLDTTASADSFSPRPFRDTLVLQPPKFDSPEREAGAGIGRTNLVAAPNCRWFPPPSPIPTTDPISDACGNRRGLIGLCMLLPSARTYAMRGKRSLTWIKSPPATCS
jgi:hypothetical protein